MVLVFRDQCRDGDARTVGFWVHVLWDVARSAPALRAEGTRTAEVIMKLAAILTVVLAVLAMLGSGAEWVACSRQGMGGTYMLSLLLAAVGFAALLGAAVTILFRKQHIARLALIASLALFLAARLLFPWMGIFVQLVGLGLPVALLIALYWPRKSSTLMNSV
jgi:hypothetical protein